MRKSKITVKKGKAGNFLASCPFNGCTIVTYGADKTVARNLMTAHLALKHKREM